MQRNAIRLQRVLAGLKQIQLAQAARISCPRLSQIECGYVPPRPDELARLAKVLGVDVNVLGGKAAA